MRTVSETWADAIAESHRVVSEVSVPGTSDLLPATAGSVTLDIKAATRGRCDLVFNDPTLIPTSHTSTLAPYGQELEIKRGLIYPNGQRELVPLGIFRIEEVEVDDTPDNYEIRVQGLDRSQRVVDASFEAEYIVNAGTGFQSAILNIVKDAYIDVAYSFDERTEQTPKLVAEEGDDRWAFVQTMAAAIGMDLYFDNEGTLVMRTIPEVGPDTDPVAYIVEGRDGVQVKPSLLSARKRWSRTDVRNRWYVTGDNPDDAGAPPKANSMDADPLSPTYYHGGFGHKPDFYSSSFIHTTAQAQQAADGRRAKEAGLFSVVDFGSIVNPALEPTDVVRIKRTKVNPMRPAEPVTLADENHIIDTITIPLTAGESMSGQTRASRA